MIKTLYISDVDGTLTRGDNHLTEKTAVLLQKAIAAGVQLVLATGRSLNGVCELVKRCGISYPLIVLNGAMIYDVNENHAVKLFPIAAPVAAELCRLYEENGLDFTSNVFIESEQRSKAFSNYEKSFPWPQQAVNTQNGLFHDERCRVDRILPHLAEGDCLYFGSTGSQEKIQSAFSLIQSVPGIKGYAHQSPYEAKKWFLDVVGEGSGKDAAALYLKALFGAEELVAFGDNYNDLPMLQVADRSYTVPEAPEEVQAVATAVLSEDLNCVAKFLYEEACRNR